MSRGFAMLRGGRTIAEVCEELELSLEQAERLEQKFIAWSGSQARASSPVPTTSPQSRTSMAPTHAGTARIVLEPDPEMLRWEQEIDEQSHRWNLGDDDDDGEPSPPSSRAA